MRDAVKERAIDQVAHGLVDRRQQVERRLDFLAEQEHTSVRLDIVLDQLGSRPRFNHVERLATQIAQIEVADEVVLRYLGVSVDDLP